MLHTRSNDCLSSRPPDLTGVSVCQLIGHAPGKDVIRDAYAWVIATYCNPHSSPFVPAMGLDRESFRALLAWHFPHFSPPGAWLNAQQNGIPQSGQLDEFDDLLQLLLEHVVSPDHTHHSMAHLVATACMGSNHLWYDLGLPDRKALSTLLDTHFPTLAAKNTHDMKWKKFFYRQLCERDGLIACSRPSCATCDDYQQCFGPEE